MLKECLICGATYSGGAREPIHCEAVTRIVAGESAVCGAQLVTKLPRATPCLICSDTGEVVIEDPTHPDKSYRQNCPRQHGGKS